MSSNGRTKDLGSFNVGSIPTMGSFIRRFVVIKPKEKPVVIMRRACLPEDEGRNFFEREEKTLKEARAWIKAQEKEYFGPSDYYIVKEVD